MTRFDNQNFALCGKTVSSLRRNVLLGLKHMLRSCGYTVQERRTDNVIIVSKGKQSNRFYLFGGKDERSQDLIQGITLAGVLFDEVALMPESFVNQATARCSVMGSKWWFNCNPDSPFHWFYKEWICHKVDKNLLYLHFTMDDNPSLSKEIKKRYQSLYTGVFFDRFVRGLWVVADGLVYPMVAEHKERFLISETQVIDGRYYISIDYGTHNPFSMGLWCVRGNVAMRVREWYHDSRKAKHQLTDEEYYEALENFAKGVLVQRIVIDPSAASFIATIRRHGKFTVRKAENDMLNGIRVTAALLQGGKVKISPLCKDTLREFTLYRWDEQSTEHDAVVKQDDHSMDEIRYF